MAYMWKQKNGADQAMTSPPLEERSIMMSAEIRILLSATFHTIFAEYQGLGYQNIQAFSPPLVPSSITITLIKV
jgi:hypothetical protein